MIINGIPDGSAYACSARRVESLGTVCLIPTLNESPTIREVISKAHGLTDLTVVVDGNSSDDTVAVARDSGAEVLIQEGKGKGMAIRTALSKIEADIYVIIDGDATYDPCEINAIVSPIIDGEADMVVGSRLRGQMEEGAISLTHLLGNRFFNALINFLNNSDISDSQSGFRAVAGRAFRNLGLSSKGFEIETEITVRALRNGLKVKEVPIRYMGRRGSPSKLSGLGAGTRILWTILRCSFETSLAPRERIILSRAF
ncbi:glycosyltransferase family 2 protein [Candidatus Bathyarchaeota archaeon]|nr:glycosyltransferase family 2 protein [Candidatus Bathyarchaeota archaeon]